MTFSEQQNWLDGFPYRCRKVPFKRLSSLLLTSQFARPNEVCPDFLLWFAFFAYCAHWSFVCQQEDPEKVKKLLSISKDAFRKILETKDPNNVYAAHGMGAVLAEQATRRPLPSTDHLIHVKKAFEKVRAFIALTEILWSSTRENPISWWEEILEEAKYLSPNLCTLT